MRRCGIRYHEPVPLVPECDEGEEREEGRRKTSKNKRLDFFFFFFFCPRVVNGLLRPPMSCIVEAVPSFNPDSMGLVWPWVMVGGRVSGENAAPENRMRIADIPIQFNQFNQFNQLNQFSIQSFNPNAKSTSTSTSIGTRIDMAMLHVACGATMHGCTNAEPVYASRAVIGRPLDGQGMPPCCLGLGFGLP